MPAGALAIDKIICDVVNKAKEETALIRPAKVAGAWTVRIAGWVVSGVRRVRIGKEAGVEVMSDALS